MGKEADQAFQNESPLLRLKQLNDNTSKQVAEMLGGLISSLPTSSIWVSGKTNHLYYFCDYLGMISGLIDLLSASVASEDRLKGIAEKVGCPLDQARQASGEFWRGLSLSLLSEGQRLAEKQVRKTLEQADIAITGWISVEVVGGLTGKEQQLRREFLHFLTTQIKDQQGFRKRGGKLSKFNLGRLNEHYSGLYPTCRDARTIYRQNSTRPNWAGMVKAVFPEMDNDLILQLSYPEVPPDVFDCIGKQGGSSKPSDIALEWAARCCGVPHRKLSVSYLKEVRRNLR